MKLFLLFGSVVLLSFTAKASPSDGCPLDNRSMTLVESCEAASRAQTISSKSAEITNIKVCANGDYAELLLTDSESQVTLLKESSNLQTPSFFRYFFGSYALTEPLKVRSGATYKALLSVDGPFGQVSSSVYICAHQ